MKYCAEAERCTHDIMIKLHEWNVSPEEKDYILEKLHEGKFLDDHRYAKSYVSEKWNLDRWGKIKIANALQKKGIDEKLIQRYLDDLDDKEYISNLHLILHKKLKDVKSDDVNADAKRVMMYALSKGFEEELIQEWLEEVIKI